MELWEVLLAVASPLILLVAGLFTRIGLPKKVNWFVGYRTSLACKNQDTWGFAHKYWGKLMIIFGIIALALCIAGVILVERGIFELEHGMLIGASGVISLIFVILSIIPTEIALRKEFDKDGIRRR